MMNSIQHSFDRAMNTYDKHCQLQMHTSEKLIEMIKFHDFNFKSIIDLGCGTGKTTEKLASLYLNKNLHAIDLSSGCLDKAKKRLSNYNIKIYEENFDLISSAEKFDLAFSNMALHWSDNLQHCFSNIYHLLDKEGYFIFSIPTMNTFHQLQPHFSVNPFYNKQTIVHFLQQNHFSLLHSETEIVSYPFNNTLCALKSIKQVGANFVKKRNYTGLNTLARIKDIHINELTYVITYFIAFKKDAASKHIELITDTISP